MNERDGGRRITRRQALRKIAFGTSLALFAGDQMLKEGIMIKPPDLTPHLKRISLESMKDFGTARDGLELLSNAPRVRLGNESHVYYNRWGELIFQHTNAEFDPDREYRFSHRSGNRRFMVDKAIRMGANGFDIDANDFGGGEIIAEHGIVRSLDLGLIQIGGVVDVHEQEVRSRVPRSVSDMIDYIGERSNPADPFVIEIQLKRGQFSNIDALEDVVKAICRNKLPTKVFAHDQGYVDNLYEASRRYGESSVTA